MYNLFLVCVCLFELLISYIFFSQQGERRQKTWVCWTVGAALFLFGAALNILLDNIIWLNGIYFFLSNMLYGALLFDIRWPKAAFCAAILDALVVSTEFIGLTLTSLFTDTEMTAYNDKLSLLVLAGQNPFTSIRWRSSRCLCCSATSICSTGSRAAIWRRLGF